MRSVVPDASLVRIWSLFVPGVIYEGRAISYCAGALLEEGSGGILGHSRDRYIMYRMQPPLRHVRRVVVSYLSSSFFG